MTWFELIPIAFVAILGLIVLYALWRGPPSHEQNGTSIGMPVPCWKERRRARVSTNLHQRFGCLPFHVISWLSASLDELLLAESLRVAHAAGALRSRDLKRVTVDTTVQPKNITFPTDAKLLHAAVKGLVRLAQKHGVQLRQSYRRVAKHAAMMAGRYAHAKQFKRLHRQLRLLRTRLCRLIRDIRRKIAGRPEIEAAFEWPLACASQIRSQQQRQRGWKLYSFHAPEVECIGKGKASAPYEFGVKASIVTTNARAPGGQFVLHAKALPGKARTAISELR